mgnify:CR=1 FL=1|jgi:hypothetical protein
MSKFAPTVDNEYYYKSLKSDGKLYVKLPSTLYDDAKRKAETEGTTISAVVKDLLVDYLFNKIPTHK